MMVCHKYSRNQKSLKETLARSSNKAFWYSAQGYKLVINANSKVLQFA